MGIFNIEHKSKTTKARSGTITLPHGQVKTPIFMSIGTSATVKTLSKEEMETLNTGIMLSNTYHLWQEPGLETLEKAGGVHGLTGWDKVLITDSGGFQAFSLGRNVKFTEEGVRFNNPVNGNKMLLTPEKSMQIQNTIGSDITLVLDELSSNPTKEDKKKALYRTRRWAERSLNEWKRLNPNWKWDGTTPVIFGIPQGMGHADLRRLSAELTKELDFAGYSIGGVAPWEFPLEVIIEEVDATTDVLEEEKPRHLLGVGTPEQMVLFVSLGIDMFDCVYPTRNARHGSFFIKTSDNTYTKNQIKNNKFKHNFEPVNPNSRFRLLRETTFAYLRHMFVKDEQLGQRILTLNNLEFYDDLMKECRRRIEDGSFDEWYKDYKQA